MSTSVTVDSVRDNHITFGSSIAATAFLVYDTLIYFADEVDFIWSGPGILIKVIYICIRYIPPLVIAAIIQMQVGPGDNRVWSPSACMSWLIYQSTVTPILIVVVQVVLIIRIYVLFDRNRFVLAVVLALFIAEIGGLVAVTIIDMSHMKVGAGCLVIHAPDLLLVFRIIPLTLETVLFGLTLVKFLRSMASFIGRRSVLYILVRDGTWAFAVIFAIFLVNTLLFQLLNNPLGGLAFCWEISILSFAGSHVLLNLRRLAMEGPWNDFATRRTAEDWDEAAAQAGWRSLSFAPASLLADEGSITVEPRCPVADTSVA